MGCGWKVADTLSWPPFLARLPVPCPGADPWALGHLVSCLLSWGGEGSWWRCLLETGGQGRESGVFFPCSWSSSPACGAERFPFLQVLMHREVLQQPWMVSIL